MIVLSRFGELQLAPRENPVEAFISCRPYRRRRRRHRRLNVVGGC